MPVYPPHPLMSWSDQNIMGFLLFSLVVLQGAAEQDSAGVVEGGHHAGFHVVSVVAVQHPHSGVVGEKPDGHRLHRFDDEGVLAGAGGLPSGLTT